MVQHRHMPATYAWEKLGTLAESRGGSISDKQLFTLVPQPGLYQEERKEDTVAEPISTSTPQMI